MTGKRIIRVFPRRTRATPEWNRFQREWARPSIIWAGDEAAPDQQQLPLDARAA